MSSEVVAGSTAEKYQEISQQDTSTHKDAENDEGTTDGYTQNNFESAKNQSSQNLVDACKVNSNQVLESTSQPKVLNHQDQSEREIEYNQQDQM